MTSRMQRLIGGPLARGEITPGAWRLRAPGGDEVIVRGAVPAEVEIATRGALKGASVDWLREGALVTLITNAGPVPLHASTVVTHQPLARLYEALPLATLDGRARRFWRRVFLLVRIPGGRRLLKLLARRTAVPE
jgi:hypothetical protein